MLFVNLFLEYHYSYYFYTPPKAFSRKIKLCLYNL
jgi:hypothetical protein